MKFYIPKEEIIFKENMRRENSVEMLHLMKRYKGTK